MLQMRFLFSTGFLVLVLAVPSPSQTEQQETLIGPDIHEASPRQQRHAEQLGDICAHNVTMAQLENFPPKVFSRSVKPTGITLVGTWLRSGISYGIKQLSEKKEPAT